MPDLLINMLYVCCRCIWSHSAREIPASDWCFFLSYSHIVEESTLAKFKNSFVVHESDLPKGRGWSPMSWQIIEGKNQIPVTLIKAEKEVDSGDVYGQRWIKLEGHELIGELREKQARETMNLCVQLLSNLPCSLGSRRQQSGVPTYYPRRRPKDSAVDVHKTLAEQFSLLRVVDNDRYPAFFEYCGRRYILTINKDQSLA